MKDSFKARGTLDVAGRPFTIFRLSALDASFVARKAVGLDQDEIPNIPGAAPAPPVFQRLDCKRIAPAVRLVLAALAELP